MGHGNLISTVPYAVVGEFLKELQQRGVSTDDLNHFRCNPRALDRAAEDMRRGGTCGTISLAAAEHLMGQRIFGYEAWKDLLRTFRRFVWHQGIGMDQEVHRFLLHLPWDAEVLLSPCPFTAGKLVRDTHFAFLGLPDIGSEDGVVPLTVRNWSELVGKPAVTIHDARDLGSLSEETCELRWYLVYPDRTIDWSTGLRNAGYAIGSAVEIVTASVLFYTRFERLVGGGHAWPSPAIRLMLDQLKQCISFHPHTEFSLGNRSSVLFRQPGR